MGPAVIVYDLSYAPDPSLNKSVLSPRNVPDGIANHILTRRRAGEPLLVRQIIRNAMKNSIDIGELFLEICRDVHGFLTPVRYPTSRPEVQPPNAHELSRRWAGKVWYDKK
jgi:hypothetical protein